MEAPLKVGLVGKGVTSILEGYPLKSSYQYALYEERYGRSKAALRCNVDKQAKLPVTHLYPLIIPTTENWW